jgi:hypothetical protein
MDYFTDPRYTLKKPRRGRGESRPLAAYTNNFEEDASSTMTKRLFAVLIVLCAGITVSAQQAPKYLTSVALFKVPPGQESAFVEKGKGFAPLLDKLITDGVVNAYGIDVDILHVPGENNIAFWVEVPDFAAMDKLDKAEEEFEKQHADLMQELRAMADPATHHDLIVGTHESNARSAPAGSMPVDDFDMVRVKPGRMSEFRELFRKYDQPVLDKLVADEVIYAYELDTEAVHTMEPGMVWIIVVMPDLGAKDKVEAAFLAAYKSLPAGEREMTDKLYYDMIVPGSHRDQLSVSVVFKTK